MSVVKGAVFTAISGLLVFANLGCTLVLVPTEPTTANVQFLNLNKETTTTGSVIQYNMRNIEALGQTWSETVSYGDKTSIIAVSPHTGSITVTGEIRSQLDSKWTSGSWTINQDIVAGQDYVLELTL